MLIVAVLVSLLEISFGPYNIDFFRAYEVFFNHLFGHPSGGTDDYVVWEKSVPRMIAVLTAGSAMGVCGAAMQSTLKNPLADPYITGISSGANFGVALATIAGIFIIPGITGDLGLILNAFLISLVPALAIISLSSLRRRTGPTTMILIGIAVMYLFGACTTMLKLTASDESYATVFAWSLGTLGSITWKTVPFLVSASAAAAVLFCLMNARLNLLSDNDDLALTSGLSVRRVRLISICAVSLTTATIVCFTGTIGFVGLVAPHIMRIFMGSDNRYLIPASAAAGAFILAAADCIAIEITPTGLPVGVITSIIGGPVFVYILIKQHKRTWNRADTMELNIDNLSFGYDEKPVLKNISIKIDGPQFVSVLGPNGVGKSTLIHCINRILEPTSGNVYIDGKDVKEYPLKELAKIIGYVPYSSQTSFPMSVVDTVMLGRYPHSGNRRTDEDLKIVHSAIKLMGIEDLSMRMFNELSAGQHQKVMLARGLVQGSGILLLDEPTSNLDIMHQMSVAHLLRDLAHKKGIMIVMICHDLNIASRYSDRLIMMHDGSIYADGTPEEVLTSGNIQHVYGVRSEIITYEGRPHMLASDSGINPLIEE